MNFMLATFGGSKIEIIPVFDVIIVIVGLVTIVAAYRMKKNNQPPQWLLNPADLARLKDVSGFCDYLGGRAVIFGIICIACGIFGEFEMAIIRNNIAKNVGLIIFLFAVIWFFNELQRSKNKFS